MNDRKRELRKLKRVIKKAGTKHRRRELKRDLRENPEEAAFSAEKLGRNRSETLNGLDASAKLRKDEAIEPAPGEYAPDE